MGRGRARLAAQLLHLVHVPERRRQQWALGRCWLCNATRRGPPRGGPPRELRHPVLHRLAPKELAAHPEPGELRVLFCARGVSSARPQPPVWGARAPDARAPDARALPARVRVWQAEGWNHGVPRVRLWTVECVRQGGAGAQLAAVMLNAVTFSSGSARRTWPPHDAMKLPRRSKAVPLASRNLVCTVDWRSTVRSGRGRQGKSPGKKEFVCGSFRPTRRYLTRFRYGGLLSGRETQFTDSDRHTPTPHGSRHCAQRTGAGVNRTNQRTKPEEEDTHTSVRTDEIERIKVNSNTNRVRESHSGGRSIVMYTCT